MTHHNVPWVRYSWNRKEQYEPPNTLPTIVHQLVVGRVQQASRVWLLQPLRKVFIGNIDLRHIQGVRLLAIRGLIARSLSSLSFCFQKRTYSKYRWEIYPSCYLVHTASCNSLTEAKECAVVGLSTTSTG